MENLEVVAESSVTGQDNIKVVPSVDSSTVLSSPARPGVATSPSAASSSTHRTFQQPTSSVDLLDNHSAQHTQAYPSSRARSNGMASSDDDHTEPSSATGNYSGENPGYTRSDLNTNATSTFGRLIENTKKRLNSNDRRRNSGDDEEEEEAIEGALIFGYLQKLGRNGKWQTRWFETDGECLTYYKSSKRSKLLATLDLAKVGSISINQADSSGTSFTISISDRPYQLRADSEATCKDWVITLNRVKEARMHEGNVKLSVPSGGPLDLLKQHNNFTPRVVVVANRQRTRAIDDDDIQSWENGAPFGNDPAAGGGNFIAEPSGRLARWQKPRNSLSRLATKLAKWARSIRKIGCTDAENHVVLDHHLHPPGHDDKKKQSTSPSGKSSGIQDALSSDVSANAEDGPVPSQEVQEDDDDDEARYLS
mmetsp:Transcript_4028/g.11647  ORF Transcript_4028/g.11647 Transcript_4028/m.11647 type:complete len:423 (+) Transcript_4028:331-1599(+)|eukprot:CAMPEP_0176026320 /NCGR_PEP_ID=MMETSP0120_2-20121206/12892_1 /TAXON_ID=160619 /ORGANISM="Kryptoperidinium foliaceum, Strain CCMP 1326" /LENGTH=422 /DNA_ID=CAMNT_0017359517 /DNA_START=369 /DNA_END=1637 /DNA_ORIENTATION=-